MASQIRRLKTDIRQFEATRCCASPKRAPSSPVVWKLSHQNAARSAKLLLQPIRIRVRTPGSGAKLRGKPRADTFPGLSFCYERRPKRASYRCVTIGKVIGATWTPGRFPECWASGQGLAAAGEGLLEPVGKPARRRFGVRRTCIFSTCMPLRRSRPNVCIRRRREHLPEKNQNP